jgi:predicted GNAT family acetyltransferase
MVSAVRDNGAAERYEMDVAGKSAFITYRRAPGVVTLLHAEVPQEFSGQGVGSQLVRQALELARAEGCKVVPRCPFVADFIEEHAEFQNLLAAPR